MVLPLALVAFGAVTAAPAPTERAQLLILDLDAIEVDPSLVSILNGRVAALLSERDDVEALTASDIQAMAKLDASKAAMGCEETSCLAEIANAMGAKYVVYGRVGKLDDLYLLQLNLFDAALGKPVARQEAQAPRLQELSAKMPDVMNNLMQPLGGKPVSAGAVVENSDGGLLGSPLFLAGAGALAVGAVAGVAFGGWALAMNGDLESPTASLEAKQAAFDNGALVASLGIAGAVVAVAGGVALGVALAE